MKFRQKLSLLSMVSLLAVPLFLVGPNGKPMMSLEDWTPDLTALKRVINTAKNVAHNGELASMEGLSVIGESLTASAKPASPQTLYKWKDKKGVWQFSSTPPPEDVDNAQMQALPKMANVMQPVVVREAVDKEGPSRSVSLPFPTTIPLQDIPKLVEDARNVQKLSDGRQAALDKI